MTMTNKNSADFKLPVLQEAPVRRVVSVSGANGKVQKIRGRLLRALDLMIWGDPKGRPLDWDKAAGAAGLTVRAMRKALAKAHVRAFVQTERRVCMDAVGGRRELAPEDQVVIEVNPLASSEPENGR